MKNRTERHIPSSPTSPIHSRGYLPHIEGADYQMITYRLADALPKDVIARIPEALPKQQKRELIENAADKSYGRCWLAQPQIAERVMENWRYFDGVRYELVAHVVMPNHVHVLIRVRDGNTLSSIVHGWKSYTAKKVVDFAKSAGEPLALPVWQAEYWDRYIRNQRHFDAAVEYIHQNPVKAGLVASAEKWRWSSAVQPGSAGGPPANAPSASTVLKE